MTDRLRRERSLPKGYQFGDAHEHDYRARYVASPFVYHAICEVCGHDAGPVNVDRITMIEGLNLQPRMARVGRPRHWNVIEGEHFDSDADRPPVIEGAR